MKKYYSFSKNWTLALAFAAATQGAWAIDVKDEAGLRAMANDLAGEYTLTADITLTSAWTPIGSDATPFTGKFNGNGHVIKNLKVDNRKVARGAFINSAQNATISKVGLENVFVVGNEDVGGLVGKDCGGNSISECYVTGYVSGRDHVGAIIGGSKTGYSLVENCYALAFIHSYEYQAGGLIGTPMDIEFNNCYFSGSVYTRSNCVGGLAALIDGGDSFAVNNSFVAAPIIIKSDADDESRRGRILGNESGRAFSFSNNFALAGTELGLYYSPSVPVSEDASSKQGADATMEDFTSATFVSDILGWDKSVWTLTDGALPRLAWQTAAVAVDDVMVLYAGDKVSIEKDKPTKIAVGTLPGVVYTSSNPDIVSVDAKGFITGHKSGVATITASVAANATHGAVTGTIEVKVMGVNYTITTPDDLFAMRYDLAGTFTLGADIDMAGYEDFTPIGTEGTPFTGTFNGEGHTIKNLTVRASGDNQGFFGTARNANISKVAFDNLTINWDGNGGANIGGIVGRSYGAAITQCAVLNSYVRGRDHVGAIIGGSFNGGDAETLVEDCYSNSYIYSTSYQCAGIMGTMINAHINRCYFSGVADVNGNTNAGAMVSLIDGDPDVMNSITNSVCLAVNINGSEGGSGRILGNTGGRTPGDANLTLDNNYGYDGTSCPGAGSETDAVVNGRQGQSCTFEEAIDAAFYTDVLGWDMTDTWQMIPGSFPILKWQSLPVNGSFFGLPATITLIEGKSAFDTSAIKGSLGQGYTIEEVGTSYLRIRADISVKSGAWPEKTVNTAIRVISDNSDIACEVEIPVTIIPKAESMMPIRNAADLLQMNEKPGLDYVLLNDIDMTGVDFPGIGSEEKPFSGVFDGNGHIIANLSRNFASGNRLGGLFNWTNGATIKNVGLQNVNLVAGRADIGGLCGYGVSTTVSQCYVNGGVVQGFDHVGGIFGGGKKNRIMDCFVNASIRTDGYQAAGISGVASGIDVTNCYAAGEAKCKDQSWPNRAGGIVALVEDAGNSFIGVASMVNLRGGIVGRILASAEGWARVPSVMTGVYSNEAILETGEGYESGNGFNFSYEKYMEVDDKGNDWSKAPRLTEADGRSLNELMSWGTYSAMGWDPAIWTMPEAGGFPILKAVKYNDPSGVEAVAGAAPVIVYGTTNGVHVECEDECTVNIYNFSGLLIGQYHVWGTATIELPAAMYIVNVKSEGVVKNVKVSVR